MIFRQIIDRLKDRLLNPLPGDSAHAPMRALPIGDLTPRFDHSLPPKPGGVLILLYEDDKGSIRFPLIKRQEYTGAHSGQVSLPGGKAEPGEDPIQTALRECEEEIGVDKNSVVVLGRLTNFFVIPSNFIITPVVAIADSTLVFRPDPYEVARILSFPLSDLLNDDAIKQKEIVAAGKFRMMAPHFEIDGEIVWGATAMMLNEFRTILRDR
ncbi:MAG TPA: CoA pyrophosphatase [Chryseolinea sp.]